MSPGGRLDDPRMAVAHVANCNTGGKIEVVAPGTVQSRSLRTHDGERVMRGGNAAWDRVRAACRKALK